MLTKVEHGVPMDASVGMLMLLESCSSHAFVLLCLFTFAKFTPFPASAVVVFLFLSLERSLEDGTDRC